MPGAGVAPRVAAFAVLRDVSGGGYADRAAARRFDSISGADRRLAQELAYGTIRLRGRLDTELAPLCRRPLSDLDAPLLDALRLGLYQLRETRIPPHAAVNETLDAARDALSSGARGLANAVLRRAAREGRNESVFPTLEEDPVGRLATWGSHPDWLLRRWLTRWPLAEVERLVENNNRAPRVTLRLLGGAPDAGEWNRLAAHGLERVEGHESMAMMVSGAPGDAMRVTRAIAQDPAASLVVDYVSRGLEGPFLDACAAPGGKTLGLWFASPARPLIAADVSRDRLEQVRGGAATVGAEPLLLVMDARRPAVSGIRGILLDAPCSGTGVFRRRPDSRWRLTAKRLEDLVKLQSSLLDSAALLLEPGGLLVYATCSIEREENEEQVQRFLERHGNFERDGSGPDRGQDLFVKPWEQGTDGAYASRLRKRSEG